MKFFTHIVSHLTVFALVIFPVVGNAEEQQKRTVTRPSVRRLNSAEAELARLRAEVIEKMKESKAGAEKLLALHEEEKNKLTELYKQRLGLYQQGIISRVELIHVQRALAMAIVRVDEDKRWIGEYDIAQGSATYNRGLARFSDNLRAILSKARRAGVPVLLSELVSNVRDQPPFFFDLPLRYRS